MNQELTSFHKTVVGVQFLFVAFGALVLMPLLVGLDPSTAMLSAGVGTLIFHVVTKGKVPVFLGSNTVIIALMLSIGVGGAVFTVGSFSLSSIGLAAIVGIILNLILPGRHGK